MAAPKVFPRLVIGESELAKVACILVAFLFFFAAFIVGKRVSGLFSLIEVILRAERVTLSTFIIYWQIVPLLTPRYRFIVEFVLQERDSKNLTE